MIKEEFTKQKLSAKEKLEKYHLELEEIRGTFHDAREAEINKVISLLILTLAEIETLTYKEDWKEMEKENIKKDIECKIENVNLKMNSLKEILNK